LAFEILEPQRLCLASPVTIWHRSKDLRRRHWRPSLLKVQRIATLSIRSFPLSAAKKVLNVTVQQRHLQTQTCLYTYIPTHVSAVKSLDVATSEDRIYWWTWIVRWVWAHALNVSRRTVCRESLKITNFRLKYLRN